ncbi:MAG: DUF1501 domain-containing protein [Bacteroidetes bacterium]|nr:DUF1501 domain-containing protein [Bacteroidota bacterium]
MNRKKFIQLTASAASGFLVLPSFLTAQDLLSFESDESNENRLVFIQLNGGNDGLNTFIPYENPLYYSKRPHIGISKDNIINPINGMAFHPALKDFGTIAQEGNLTVIQNVGYPNPNRSHFRSQEIWQTASDSNQFLDYGWLGRYLDIQCNDGMLPSVNLGSIDNLALKASMANGITLRDVNRVKKNPLIEYERKLTDNPQLDFVRKIQQASIEGMNEINQAYKNAKKYNEPYATSGLAKNLESIARLIKGNLGSKVYYTSLSGFDTHTNQAQQHNRQLTVVNDAVYSFYSDLKTTNLLDRVTLVLFSEFGRRVQENGSGTDHGTAGPMFIIGGKNKGNVLGKNPDLEILTKGDLIYDIDFRSVYASLLIDKFNFDPTLINIKNQALKGIF